MRRVALLAALLLTATAVVIPATASPQPTPVCRYCGTFDEAAADNGANVTLTESTVDVQVHANGSATWTVRNDLDSAKPFRENPAALDATVRQLTDEGFGLPEEPARVQHRLDGETVVITVQTPDAAERRAGVLVVDLLHDEGREPWHVVNADRFTIHGPAGTVISNTPASGTVEDGRVTWTGESDETYQAPSLNGSPYVAFGPDDTTATELRTTAALALATLPITLSALRGFVVPQAIVFTAVIAGVGVGIDGRQSFIDSERLVVGLLVGAAIMLVAAVIGGRLSPNVLLGVAPASVYLLAAGLLRADRPPGSPRRLAAVALGVAAVVGLVAFLFPWSGYVEPLPLAVRTALSTFALAALLPFGAAVVAGSRRWWAVPPVAFVIAVVTLVDLTALPIGLSGGLQRMGLFVAAVVVPLVGTPLALVGARLHDPRATDAPTPDGSDGA
jgi:hypothetical protein